MKCITNSIWVELSFRAIFAKDVGINGYREIKKNLLFAQNVKALIGIDQEGTNKVI